MKRFFLILILLLWPITLPAGDYFSVILADGETSTGQDSAGNKLPSGRITFIVSISATGTVQLQCLDKATVTWTTLTATGSYSSPMPCRLPATNITANTGTISTWFVSTTGSD